MDRRKASLERREKEREIMDQRRKQEEEEKRYRSSRPTSVDGKEEHKRPMSKSNHSISLGCDVETLEEYTTELERKSGEKKILFKMG